MEIFYYYHNIELLDMYYRRERVNKLGCMWIEKYDRATRDECFLLHTFKKHVRGRHQSARVVFSTHWPLENLIEILDM